MGWTVDPAVAKAAVERLEPAPQEIGGARSSLSGIAQSQDSVKWGPEWGPLAFAGKYTEALAGAGQQIATMEEQLTRYIQSMRDAIAAFERTDSDIEARIAVTHGQEQAIADVQQADAAPALSSGSAGAGEGAGGGAGAAGIGSSGAGGGAAGGGGPSVQPASGSGIEVR